MPAPARFTRAQLQQAALDLVDSQGVAALSMRTLASALGTGPMTIYNYVRDRDALDELVVEAVLANARWPDASDDWRRDVRTIVQAMWDAIDAHPHAVPLILSRRTLHEGTLLPAEALLAALSRSGRSGPALLAAFRAVLGFVTGLAQVRLARQPGDDDPDIARARELDPARFPKLLEIADAAASVDPDYELRAGLDIILAGLSPADAPSSSGARSARGSRPRRARGSAHGP
ncbi:MAG: TetR/AcrR family transcriptional regulator [Alphaproteobacteria bacterium]|nr:TetR/AcrR family transcriptional regulator [Alphaproteobacteria bacterium]MCW5743052.1 TetR/AcrR family transcriptional regulator [Alphaproteobacteria bacterium]